MENYNLKSVMSLMFYQLTHYTLHLHLSLFGLYLLYTDSASCPTVDPRLCSPVANFPLAFWIYTLCVSLFSCEVVHICLCHEAMCFLSFSPISLCV